MNSVNTLKVCLGLSALAAAIFGLQIGTAFGQPKIRRQTGALGAKTLCRAEEETVWSCTTRKNKIASICASKDLTDEKGYIQYRFGLPDRIELRAPESLEGSQSFFRYRRYTRPLVTMLTLSFTNGDHSYEIHADTNAEGEGKAITTWIDVLNADGKTVSSVDCRLPAVGSLIKLEDIVPDYEEFENQ